MDIDLSLESGDGEYSPDFLEGSKDRAETTSAQASAAAVAADDRISNGRPNSLDLCSDVWP
jgi:hypothetical protein